MNLITPTTHRRVQEDAASSTERAVARRAPATRVRPEARPLPPRLPVASVPGFRFCSEEEFLSGDAMRVPLGYAAPEPHEGRLLRVAGAAMLAGAMGLTCVIALGATSTGQRAKRQAPVKLAQAVGSTARPNVGATARPARARRGLRRATTPVLRAMPGKGSRRSEHAMPRAEWTRQESNHAQAARSGPSQHEYAELGFER
jgi:hypothetical protein